jgi:hypothetical protein
MSNRYHKAIIGEVIMVKAGKGKAFSVEFALRQVRMAAAQKGVLQNYEGRLWALCHPEKEDNTPPQVTLGMIFWDDEKWTRPHPMRFVASRYSNRKKDSVIEVKTCYYSMYFKNA